MDFAAEEVVVVPKLTWKNCRWFVVVLENVLDGYIFRWIWLKMTFKRS